MGPQKTTLPRPGRIGERLAVLAAALCLAPLPAAADIVHFTSGHRLSVKSHRMEGDQLVLALRSGGEIACSPSVVARISPDEVPYAEPAPVPVATVGDAGFPLDRIIREAAARNRLDPRLLMAVIRVESNFQPRARSPRGAMGLMQLMPDTARQYEVEDAYDAHSNVDAGARHLRSLLDRFDLSLALAAYNAGEAAVRRFGGIPPYRETQDYVRRILSLVQPGRGR
jgi:soluble lytic murein transglycosylase-like protein